MLAVMFFITCKPKTCKIERAMFILKAGIDDKLDNYKLFGTLNRGGLWAVNRAAQLIFEKTKHFLGLPLLI